MSPGIFILSRYIFFSKNLFQQQKAISNQFEFFFVAETNFLRNVEESYTSLDSEPYVPPLKQKEGEKKEERNAKMQSWKSLTKSLKSKMLEECASEPKSDNLLAEKANLFGKVVTDTLLQYEIKEWVYLKKKIMDVFLTMISKTSWIWAHSYGCWTFL